MNWKIVLGLMVCFGVMMSSSYTMLIPFLPIYLARELNCPDESLKMWSGLLFAVTFCISAFAAPLWGRLTDKVGKKPMVIRSSILLAVTYFLGGIVQTPFQMLLARAFQGIAAGLWPACLVLMAAYVPKSRLGISMGLMQSANICGGILGPLLGGILATLFGMRNSFFVGASALTLITVMTVLFIREPPRDQPAAREQPAVSSRELLRHRGILTILIAVGLTNFVMLQIQPIATLYISELAAGSDNVVLLCGLVFSSGGVAGALASPFWGRGGQRIGFYRTLTASMMIGGFLIMMLSLPGELYIFAIIQFIWGLGFSGVFPSANSILILLTPPSARGAGFGMMFSAQMCGGALGPVFGGFIATLVSLSAVYMLAGGILFCLGLFILFKAPEELKIAASPQNEDLRGRDAYMEKIKRRTIAQIREKNADEAKKN